MNLFGFSKNNYYKVGHAAIVLVEYSTGNCFYFDFGRYHAPYGYGRVRDAETDHDLKIFTKAKFDADINLLNFNQILNEISQNEAYHGTGTLHASYAKIDFKIAYQKAKSIQDKNPWEYGPFVWSGTNCSRFVRTIICSGKPPLMSRLKTFIPLTLTPLPIGNVKSLKEHMSIKVANEIEVKSTISKSLHNTLDKPERLASIPKNSQWLAGEGAGSWFHLSSNENKFTITRYSTQGKIECVGNFEITNNIKFDINSTYQFTHQSHCKSVSLIQNKILIELTRVSPP